MHTSVMPAPSRVAITRPGLPSPRRFLGILLLVAVVCVTSTIASSLAYLQVPEPTGPYAVGRTDDLLVDEARREPASRGGDHRVVRVVAWYPAVAGTGSDAPYVPGFDAIREGLAASGELSAPVVAGLPFVRTTARSEAAIATGHGRWPVIVLSPGNATNVAFYASLAEDLASRGFAVIGVDHPYQSAAVDIGAGRVAVYDARSVGDAGVAARIDERMADIRLVLDRLIRDGATLGTLRDQLDLGRIGVAGHSNGGLAAVGMCTDARVAACANIDGQAAGGPFGVSPDPTSPTKPFLFLTKETGLHPALAAVFEAAGPDAYRVVVPAAAHDTFADGSRFAPRLAPVDGTAEHVMVIERDFVAAFFDRTLRGATGEPFDGLRAPTDVYVESYPLRGRPSLPTEAGPDR